jgi:hypothetical protein
MTYNFLNNFKPLEILGDTLNICPSYLLKISTLFMTIIKFYQFIKRFIKIEAKTLDTRIFFNTYPNGMKFLPHM